MKQVLVLAGITCAVCCMTGVGGVTLHTARGLTVFGGAVAPLPLCNYSGGETKKCPQNEATPMVLCPDDETYVSPYKLNVLNDIYFKPDENPITNPHKECVGISGCKEVKVEEYKGTSGTGACTENNTPIP